MTARFHFKLLREGIAQQNFTGFFRQVTTNHSFAHVQTIDFITAFGEQIDRTPDEMLDLFRRSAFRDDHLELRKEPNDVNLYVFARRKD